MTRKSSPGESTALLDRFIARLRSNRGLVRFIKFGLVGGLGVFVNLGIYAIGFQVLELHDFLARIIAIEISILHNFAWNFSWTWRDRGRQFSSIPVRLLRYHGSTLISSYGVTLGIGWILMKILPDIFMAPYISHASGVVGGMVVNFLVSDKWVFIRKTDDSNG